MWRMRYVISKGSKTLGLYSSIPVMPAKSCFQYKQTNEGHESQSGSTPLNKQTPVKDESCICINSQVPTLATKYQINMYQKHLQIPLVHLSYKGPRPHEILMGFCCLQKSFQQCCDITKSIMLIVLVDKLNGVSFWGDKFMLGGIGGHAIGIKFRNGAKMSHFRKFWSKI